MLTFLVLSAAWAADCPATTAQLVDTITAAEAAFVDMNPAGFERARALGEVQIGCLSEAITPPDAAAWHRVEALSAFIAQDDASAVAAFRSSLALQPAFALPSRIAPDGHPLRALYDQAKAMPPSATEPMPPPKDTLLYVDGSRAPERPTERPFVLQGMAASGAITGSAALPAAASLPEWARGEAVAVAAPATREPREPGQHRARVPLLIASAASLVVAGTTYGIAWSDRATFDDPNTNPSELDAWRRRTNTATATSVAMGGLAVGLCGAAVVIPW